MVATFPTDSNIPFCSYCHRNTLKESTVTYTSHGKVYNCTHCGRRTYETTTYTGEDPISDEPEKKRESWFERDKREKKLLNLRKKRKK